jgi:hypothetical protein
MNGKARSEDWGLRAIDVWKRDIECNSGCWQTIFNDLGKNCEVLFVLPTNITASIKELYNHFQRENLNHKSSLMENNW